MFYRGHNEPLAAEVVAYLGVGEPVAPHTVGEHSHGPRRPAIRQLGLVNHGNPAVVCQGAPAQAEGRGEGFRGDPVQSPGQAEGLKLRVVDPGGEVVDHGLEEADEALLGVVLGPDRAAVRQVHVLLVGRVVQAQEGRRRRQPLNKYNVGKIRFNHKQ